MERRLMSYLYFFNVKRDYFECHEYGESLWLDTGRPVVLKGLIQAAVSIYHLQNGNVLGAYAMWQRAKTYLAPSFPRFEGLDLLQLAHDMDELFSYVPSTFYDRVVAPDVIAELHLPTVTIQVADADILNELDVFVPEPLDE